MYLRCLLFIVFYTLCGASILQPLKFNVVLVTPLFKKLRSYIQLNLFKLFAVVPLFNQSELLIRPIITVYLPFYLVGYGFNRWTDGNIV